MSGTSLLHCGEAITIATLGLDAGGPKTHRVLTEPPLPPRTQHGGHLNANLTSQSIVVAAKDQLSCALGGEAAILNMKDGIYYGLDPIGADVWNLIQTPQRVADLREAMLRNYDVVPELCERDLIALLENLFSKGLIEVHSTASV